MWITTGLTKSAAGAVVREAPTPHRTYPLPCLPEQRPGLGGATQKIPGIHYPEFSEDPGYTEERHAACPPCGGLGAAGGTCGRRAAMGAVRGPAPVHHLF